MLFTALIYVYQHKLVYRPDREISQTPDEIGIAYEELYISTSDGQKIHGWYIKPDVQIDNTVLFCHGNAGNISGRLETISLFYKLGVNVLIFDYQGYGKSTGKPGEQRSYTDALSALNYLIKEKQVPSDKIVLMGRSLGGSIATWLATKKKVAGLILDSTFTSFEAVAKNAYPLLPVSMLLQFHYPTEKYIKKISVPVLIAHSKDDTLIPYHFGRQLYEMAPEPKRFLEMQGPHSGAFITTGGAYQRSIKTFIDDVTD